MIQKKREGKMMPNSKPSGNFTLQPSTRNNTASPTTGRSSGPSQGTKTTNTTGSKPNPNFVPPPTVKKK